MVDSWGWSLRGEDGTSRLRSSRGARHPCAHPQRLWPSRRASGKRPEAWCARIRDGLRFRSGPRCPLVAVRSPPGAGGDQSALPGWRPRGFGRILLLIRAPRNSCSKSLFGSERNTREGAGKPEAVAVAPAGARLAGRRLAPGEGSPQDGRRGGPGGGISGPRCDAASGLGHRGARRPWPRSSHPGVTPGLWSASTPPNPAAAHERPDPRPSLSVGRGRPAPGGGSARTARSQGRCARSRL